MRPAVPDDLPDLARLHVLARAAAVPRMPPSVHPPAEHRAWVEGWDLSAGAEHEVWVAALGAELVGLARFTPTWLDDLYVHPAHQGRGIGTVLLQTVQALRPGGFGAWVFTSNAPARAFYAAHGFVEVRHTDGSENEERAPDVEIRWP